MKKVLSCVLAVILVMGLSAVSFGAYKSAKEDKYALTDWQEGILNDLLHGKRENGQKPALTVIKASDQEVAKATKIIEKAEKSLDKTEDKADKKEARLEEKTEKEIAKLEEKEAKAEEKADKKEAKLEQKNEKTIAKLEEKQAKSEEKIEKEVAKKIVKLEEKAVIASVKSESKDVSAHQQGIINDILNGNRKVGQKEAITVNKAS